MTEAYQITFYKDGEEVDMVFFMKKDINESEGYTLSEFIKEYVQINNIEYDKKTKELVDIEL